MRILKMENHPGNIHAIPTLFWPREASRCDADGEIFYYGSKMREICLRWGCKQAKFSNNI